MPTFIFDEISEVIGAEGEDEHVIQHEERREPEKMSVVALPNGIVDPGASPPRSSNGWKNKTVVLRVCVCVCVCVCV